MQSAEDKTAAIISLLGVTFLYRDQIPGAARTARQEWESERSQLDEPPRAKPVIPPCTWKCWTCRAALESIGKKPQCPPEETWERERVSLRRRYQIAEVEDALYWLADVDPSYAQAVWAVYVEPWPDPKTEPIAPETKAVRGHLAEAGVRWMAERLPDIRGYGEAVDPVDNQMRYWRGRGLSVRQIAQRVGRSKSTVQRFVASLDRLSQSV